MHVYEYEYAYAYVYGYGYWYGYGYGYVYVYVYVYASMDVRLYVCMSVCTSGVSCSSSGPRPTRICVTVVGF